MNQEKIMKTRLYIAVFIAIIAVIAMVLSFGLYADERRKTAEAYKTQYIVNLTGAKTEIDEYLQKKFDYQVRYNMVLSDLGAARTLVFLIPDFNPDYSTAINEIHYCFVKYPEQMSGKLEDVSAAIGVIIEDYDRQQNPDKYISDDSSDSGDSEEISEESSEDTVDEDYSAGYEMLKAITDSIDKKGN